jgi:hypothetical protein
LLRETAVAETLVLEVLNRTGEETRATAGHREDTREGSR